MSPVSPLTSLVTSYAGAKTRELRREATLAAFLGLMALMASTALFAAFAVFVAETYGMVVGLLAAAGLALLLGLVAIAIRAVMRSRARARRKAQMSGETTALAAASAASLIARNRTSAIVASLAVGAIAGAMARSSRQ